MAEFKVSCLSNISAITPNIDFFFFFKLLPAFSPDGPLSCHLWHTDQPDDQPDIDWNGEDCPQMLIQQGEELGSATRWHRVPCASRHITSLTHMWRKASSYDLLMSPERPAGEVASSLHDSVLLFWAPYRKPPNEFLYNVSSTHCFWSFCCSSEGCSLIKSSGLWWRTSLPWPPGPSGISLLASHKWPPSLTWSG